MSESEGARNRVGGNAPGGDGTVSTIDLWKLLAVVLMTVDHYGHFLADDETIWRAIGRASIPIWFFLIGFARSRRVPWEWLVLGAVLTALDVAYNRTISDSLLNILFSFAVLRLLLPHVERLVLPSTPKTLLLAAALLAAESAVGKVLEYGSLGWVFALVGLLHRHRLDRSEAAAMWPRVGVAVAAAGALLWVEHGVHEFPPHELLAMGALVALITAGLIAFVPGKAADLRSQQLARVIRLAGRSTLYLYAVPLVGLYLHGVLTRDGDGDDDDDSE